MAEQFQSKGILGEPVSIFCRSVGPGGTYVDLYPTANGVRTVWSNENCPYVDCKMDKDEKTEEARDGHNVYLIRWEELETLLSMKPRT